MSFADTSRCCADLEVSADAVSTNATGDAVPRTAVASGAGWCEGTNAFEVTIEATSPTASGDDPEVLVGVLPASALQVLLDGGS